MSGWGGNLVAGGGTPDGALLPCALYELDRHLRMTPPISILRYVKMNRRIRMVGNGK